MTASAITAMARVGSRLCRLPCKYHPFLPNKFLCSLAPVKWNTTVAEQKVHPKLVFAYLHALDPVTISNFSLSLGCRSGG